MYTIGFGDYPRGLSKASLLIFDYRRVFVSTRSMIRSEGSFWHLSSLISTTEAGKLSNDSEDEKSRLQKRVAELESVIREVIRCHC